MIDFWHEYPVLFDLSEDIFFDDKVDCVHFSLHRLPKVEKGRRMAAPAKAVIELSPDSHDMQVAKASGRGFYSMEEYIDALLDDVYSFEIYYMIGLPFQTPENIMANVQYCAHLLKKYEGRNVTPFVCPMLPFLDPGSEIYDHPEENGYRIFHTTLEDHRQALMSMNWKHRLNYETRWMTREQLVEMSYKAVRALTLLKNKYGVLPDGIAKSIINLIDETHIILARIDAYQAMPESPEKEELGAALRKTIHDCNMRQFQNVRSQQRPVDPGFAKQQWFDTDAAFDRVMRSDVLRREAHSPRRRLPERRAPAW